MGMILLKGNETPGEVICLAYGLEEGLRKFYSMSIKLAIGPAIVEVLTKLGEIEVKHKQRLYDLYLTIDPSPIDVDAFEKKINSEFMEGGYDPAKFLEKNMPALKTAAGVLDFAMMLEAQAMDLYMRYAEKSENPEVKNILHQMANEEKTHLRSLGNILDKNT